MIDKRPRHDPFIPYPSHPPPPHPPPTLIDPVFQSAPGASKSDLAANTIITQMSTQAHSMAK